MADELGATVGPQAAASEALHASVDGFERDGANGAAHEQPHDDTAEWQAILRVGISALFTLAASRWPAMALPDDELTVLVDTWTPVAQKHAGGAIPIEIAAIAATAFVVLPKAQRAMQEHRSRKAAAASATDPWGGRVNPETTT